MRCYAYSSHGQPRNLLRQCDGQPQSAGAKSAWSSVGAGRHPKRKGVSVEVGPWYEDLEQEERPRRLTEQERELRLAKLVRRLVTAAGGTSVPAGVELE
eukprot:2477919-Pyramimonas_sp.AAC.1